MNSDRFDRARDLYLEALTVPSGEREAWLKQRCEDDEDLVREVLELVSLAEMPDNPLDRDPIGEAWVLRHRWRRRRTAV